MSETAAVNIHSEPEVGARRRILVVDDEPSIVEAVTMALEYAGFDVTEATTGREALAVVRRDAPDLVVLDVMLPDFDGLEVTRRLRSDGIRTPILFLTAREAIKDRLAGLDVGGDDYLTKPFSLAEVVARVRAILRRTNAGEPTGARLRFADLELDPDTFEVWRGTAPISLTATEFKLLHYFMLNPRRVLSSTQILDYVWHYDFAGDPKVVQTYVSYLRRKLDRDGAPLIHTIRLVGYSLREPGQRAR